VFSNRWSTISKIYFIFIFFFTYAQLIKKNQFIEKKYYLRTSRIGTLIFSRNGVTFKIGSKICRWAPFGGWRVDNNNYLIFINVASDIHHNYQLAYFCDCCRPMQGTYLYYFLSYIDYWVISNLSYAKTFGYLPSRDWVQQIFF